MEREKLTAGRIESAQPGPTPYRLWDAKTPGLFVRVQPSGVKTFNVQWSRTSSKALGRWPAQTLDGARKRALAILHDAASSPDGVPKAAKPVPRAEASTLRQFVTGEYQAWARQNLKRGDEAVARILSVFAALLDSKLAALDHRAVEAVLTKRRKAGLSKAATNRDLGTLKAALAKAVDWKLLPGNPLATLKPAKVDTAGVVRFLSKVEEKRLRAALEARDGDLRAARARTVAGGRKQHTGLTELPRGFYGDYLTPLVLTALNTGCRRGELTALRWSDVDLAAKRLTVQAGYAKSGKARHVPLNKEAVAVLKKWGREQGTDGRIFRVHDPKKAWSAVIEAAKIEAFRFHDLRHTFASKLVMAGVDLNTVRELLGHGDIKMTLRYAHLAPEHKAAAVELLAA